MKKRPKLRQWVFAYEKYVRWIAEEAETWETLVRETLIIRDDLAAAWSKLSVMERRQVAAMDGQLVQCAGQLAELLPDEREHPHAHWWWHLHKGPQVRDMAEETTA